MRKIGLKWFVSNEMCNKWNFNKNNNNLTACQCQARFAKLIKFEIYENDYDAESIYM